MNLCLFFEGTGRGVAGKVTNVTRLRDLCVRMCGTSPAKDSERTSLRQFFG